MVTLEFLAAITTKFISDQCGTFTAYNVDYLHLDPVLSLIKNQQSRFP